MCVNRLTSGLVALAFPLLEKGFTAGGTFFFFTFLSVATVWFYYVSRVEMGCIENGEGVLFEGFIKRRCTRWCDAEVVYVDAACSSAFASCGLAVILETVVTSFPLSFARCETVPTRATELIYRCSDDLVLEQRFLKQEER